MTDQGLKATVYPEIDEAGMQKFINELSERLSATFFTVGINPRTSTSSASDGGSAASNGTSSASASPTVVISKKETSEAVADGLKESADKDPETAEKKNKSITQSLGSILGTAGTVATAIGVGAVTVATSLVGIFKFLENSSQPLNEVMNLFKTVFNLIWMPIGAILAVKLMPLLQKTFAIIGQWMGEAWQIYDTEGWVGLIHGAVSTALDVLVNLLMQEDLWIVVGTIIWELLTRLSILNLLSEAIFGEESPWTDVRNTIDALKLTAETICDTFETVKEWIEETLGPAVATIGNIINGIWEKLSSFFGSRAGNVSSAVSEIVSGNTVQGLTDLWNETPAGRVTNWFGEKFNLLKDGGIVTSTTPAIIGEAGPEAVIPLNQISTVANEITSTTIGGNTSGNVMNFYISGSNAQDIGSEVQRILEKTVGKASSKMMWW